MDAKTPVTLLQEYFVKRLQVPSYNLVENGVGTHNPTFVYSVSGFGKFALGTGSSKKEAKHAAAETLLSMLMGTDVEDVLDNPYAEASKENTVGALQDFCVTYMIAVPRYEEVSVVGDPHTRVFVIECLILPHKTRGEGRTKKQAKQIAAYLMLKKLKALLKDDLLDQVQNKTPLKPNDEKQSRAIQRLCEQLMNDVIISRDRKVVGPMLELDFVKLFNKDEFAKSDKWKNLQNELMVNMSDPVSYFTELMFEVSLNWESCLIPSKPEVTGIVLCLHIKEFGGATFFGRGLDEDIALKEAALSALNWFAVMGN